MNDNYLELILNCVSWQEAQRVVDVLLEKHLAEKTEILPVQNTQKVHIIVKTKARHLEKIKLETTQLPSTAIVSSFSLVQ
jgi:uncharacterized protein involved in tolerance to divalent cations